MSVTKEPTAEDRERADGLIRIPLINKAARDFLAGSIPAEDYMRERRMEAQEQAIKEVRTGFDDPSNLLPSGVAVPVFGVIISVTYGTLALSSFSNGRTGTGVLAILTCLIFATASYRLWRVRRPT